MNYEIFVNDAKGVHSFQDGFTSRLDAEKFACARSKFRKGNLVVREAGGPTDSCAGWISIYRSGWLHDQNKKGTSFVPADQKAAADEAYAAHKATLAAEKNVSRIERIIKRPLAP